MPLTDFHKKEKDRNDKGSEKYSEPLSFYHRDDQNKFDKSVSLNTFMMIFPSGVLLQFSQANNPLTSIFSSSDDIFLPYSIAFAFAKCRATLFCNCSASNSPSTADIKSRTIRSICSLIVSIGTDVIRHSLLSLSESSNPRALNSGKRRFICAFPCSFSSRETETSASEMGDSACDKLFYTSHTTPVHGLFFGR